MIHLFDKKEKSPLSQMIFIFFLVTLTLLNSNEEIFNKPYIYIAFILIQIIFSIYVILVGISVINRILKRLHEIKPIEKVQYIFLFIFLIVLFFLTIKSIIHIVLYISNI